MTDCDAREPREPKPSSNADHKPAHPWPVDCGSARAAAAVLSDVTGAAEWQARGGGPHPRAADHVRRDPLDRRESLRSGSRAGVPRTAPRYLESPVLLRELLELVIWEDQRIVHEVGLFLRSLTEPGTDLALCELGKIIAELRAASLGHQIGKASELRGAVIAAAEALTNTGALSARPSGKLPKAFLVAEKAFAPFAGEAQGAKIARANGRTRTGTVLPTGT